MIRKIDDDIWTVDGPKVVFTGISMNTRMTVVRLSDGRLWIHSPIQLSDDVQEFLRGLGDRVAVLVAPNKFHYMFMDPWRECYADVLIFAHEDLKKKIASLADSETLTNTTPTAYSNDLDQVLFSGNPAFREAVFFHRASASVIFTDLMQNLDANGAGMLARLYAKLDGVASPDGGVPRLYKWFSTNKRADREALEKIREWKPKSVLFCHGQPIDMDAETLLEREFSYLSLIWRTSL